MYQRWLEDAEKSEVARLWRGCRGRKVLDYLLYIRCRAGWLVLFVGFTNNIVSKWSTRLAGGGPGSTLAEPRVVPSKCQPIRLRKSADMSATAGCYSLPATVRGQHNVTETRLIAQFKRVAILGIGSYTWNRLARVNAVNESLKMEIEVYSVIGASEEEDASQML